MPIPIDDPELEDYIRQLMELTGEPDWETAIEIAVREKLLRLELNSASKMPPGEE